MRAVDVVNKLCPRANAAYIAAFEAGDGQMSDAGITTPTRLAHFLAQVMHETGGLTVLRENMNYTASRIRQVWPSRPNAVQFAGNPEGLANSVYGGSDAGNSRRTWRKFEASSLVPNCVVGNGTSNTTYQPGASIAQATEAAVATAWSAANSRCALNGALLGGGDGNAWDAPGNRTTQFFLGKNSGGTSPAPVLLNNGQIFPTRVSNAALPAVVVAA